MERGDASLDLSRLERPEDEAFRYIAEALGARYAGDLRIEGEPATARAPLAIPRQGSTLDVGNSDPRTATILDRIPVALLVLDGDSIAFANRTALAEFGYSSANVLEMAGGLGALFHRANSSQTGTMTMTTANGHPFDARVTMAPIDWAGRRSMLITVIRQEAADAVPSTLRLAEDDPLGAILDANPDPIALVTRTGDIEVANRAFQTLAGDATDLSGVLPLESERAHILDLVSLALSVGTSPTRSTAPVRATDGLHDVTVGALGGRLALVAFHKVADEGATCPAPASEDAAEDTPLAAAVREVRRLVTEASVLIVAEADPQAHGDARLAARDREVRLLRLLLLSIASRVSAGTVMRVREDGDDIVVSLTPYADAPFAQSLASGRLAELAEAAGRTLTREPGGLLRIAGAEPAAPANTLTVLDSWR
ncbi:PAS domain-containing protein [Acuticoccus mangrovi]|uniref:PAS domain-containing protein n=1 Tax=Acuticoccus mangrovi TaxID=2796142 RepID=A0A934IJ18_9HYPH|nr:PAS domain-containing protein [Acuticoccus mangrovi]MBJ3777604.1 PAS domain-containing protein [Acuticoccus mangrovi]